MILKAKPVDCLAVLDRKLVCVDFCQCIANVEQILGQIAELLERQSLAHFFCLGGEMINKIIQFLKITAELCVGHAGNFVGKV
jgi:uncharacterized metal-binding protein